MKGRLGAYRVVCAALLGYALGYALPIYARLPNLYLDPRRGAWLAGARPDSIAMGYYGQMVWGLGGALLGGALGALVHVLRGERASDGVGLLAAWTLTALLLVGAWFTWNNWP